MNVREFDPALYALIEECLQGYFVSPVLHQPDVPMLEGMRRSLETLAVREPCKCGEFCASFSTTNAWATGSRRLRVRFDVRGELVLDCDGEGVIYHVERLFDSPYDSAKAPPERFTLTPNGWVKRELSSEKNVPPTPDAIAFPAITRHRVVHLWHRKNYGRPSRRG